MKAGTEAACIAINVNRKVCAQIVDQYEGAGRLVATSQDGFTFDLYLTGHPGRLHGMIKGMFSKILDRSVRDQAGESELVLNPALHLLLSIFHVFWN